MIHPQGKIADSEVDERDYKVGSLPFAIKIPNITDHLVPEIDQSANEKLWFSCTISGTYKDICRLKNVQPTPEDLLELVEWVDVNSSRDIAGGWKVGLGENWACKFWNFKHPDDTVFYVRLTLGIDTEAIEEALRKGHFLGCSYGGNAAYNADYGFDGNLDGAEFQPPTYWHRNSVAQASSDTLCIVDNYAGAQEHNIYKLVPSLEVLVDKLTYTPSFYLVLPATPTTIETIKTQAEKDAAMIKEAQLRGFWNGMGNDDFCTREQMILMLMRATSDEMKPDEEFLEESFAKGYWNGMNERGLIFRSDSVLMLSRVFYDLHNDTKALNFAKEKGIWNGMYPTSFTTREQAILMIMRVLELKK